MRVTQIIPVIFATQIMYWFSHGDLGSPLGHPQNGSWKVLQLLNSLSHSKEDRQQSQPCHPRDQAPAIRRDIWGLWCEEKWIGLRENWNRKAPYFMGKSMVSG